jgi:hypothetical protein
MSRFLKLMSVLAIVALIAVPAFAEVQNVKVSGDIDTKVINRSNYDFDNYTSGTQDKDTWFMSTTRVQVDADLTDNVSTCVRLLNERDWNREPTPGNEGTSGLTDISLDLSYVKMKEIFYAPLTMTIGRQNIRLGNGLVIGDPDTNSTSVNTAVVARDLSVRKSFDAVRATLDYKPLTVDLLFAKANAGFIGTGKNNDDADIYGINAGYKFDKYNSEVEAYIITKHTKQQNVPLESDTVNVYGVRGSLEPIFKLVVNGELAMQNGDYRATGVSIDRSAYAVDLGVAYAIDYKWSPKVALNYFYRSGQKQGAVDTNNDTSGTGKYKAWDLMCEDQTHGIIANQIFNGNNDGVDSNGSTINVMASVVPVKDLTVAVDYYNFMLAQKWETTNYLGALPTRTLSGGAYDVRDSKDLGQEMDLSLGYDYTEDVKLGLAAGFFMPGKAFLKTNNDMASTVIADVKVAF